MIIARPLLVAFSVFAFVGAYAQTSSQQQTQGAQPQQQQGAASGQQQPGQVGAQQLIGKKVTGAQGEELGEISDVVVDLQGGKVHAGVLEFGGVAGVGGKTYVFPIEDLQPGKSQGQYTLANVEKEKLEKAQGFAQGVWPQIDPKAWGREGGGAAAGGTKDAARANLVRASELKGRQVNDKSGQEVGEVQDVTIDLQSGKLQSIVLTVKDSGKAQVAPDALSAGAGDQLVLNMDAQQVKQQAQQQQQQQRPQGSGERK